VGDATFTSTVTAGPDGSIQAAPVAGEAPRPIALAALTQINPPPVHWRGSVGATGLFTTGNAETATVGLKLDAARRGETNRITIGAGYLWGRQRDPESGDSETTVDNAFGFGKYDYFFTRQFYGLGSLRLERDRIADLDLRLTPSLGLGYQWFEGPRFNLTTEAGVAWIYENYRNAPSEDRVAARLAYRVDYRPHDVILLFHNLEWLPAFEDPLDDYNVNADAGLRATIVGGLFSELRVEWRYDSTPAPDARNTDLRYLLSVGWSF
jgi:putative salt-induced outer membrane protein YdiY